MSKVIQFILESKVELSKVVWPSRNDTIKYTATVIVFSAVIAAILGGVDYILIQALEKIVNR